MAHLSENNFKWNYIDHHWTWTLTIHNNIRRFILQTCTPMLICWQIIHLDNIIWTTELTEYIFYGAWQCYRRLLSRAEFSGFQFPKSFRTNRTDPTYFCMTYPNPSSIVWTKMHKTEAYSSSQIFHSTKMQKLRIKINLRGAQDN